jgi:hypothetical protein
MDTSTTTTSFSHQAAKLGWVCPVISVTIFALLIFSRHIVARKIIPGIVLLALSLMVIGLILDIVALFGISRHGTKGILAPAIVGLIINGLLLFFLVIIA